MSKEPQNWQGNSGATPGVPDAAAVTGGRGAGESDAPLQRDGSMLETDPQQDFLDLLMPIYARTLAYAQAITGSLMDGEDLLGDAVLSAYSRFATLRSRDCFSEWFYSILLNRFRNQRNRARLRPLKLVADFGESHHILEATQIVSSDPAELGYQLTLVKELLDRLKPRERDALLLIGSAGLTPDEAARTLKCSRRAVIQLAYRARRKLKQMLPDGALPFLNEHVTEESAK